MKSRIWESKTGEREARKKELLFCRRSESGRQDLKVSLLRKLLKKVGQLGEVKLLPRLVSKGLGRGLSATDVEAVTRVVGVPLVNVEAAADAEVGGAVMEDGRDVDVDGGAVEEDEAEEDGEEFEFCEAKGSPLSCRGSIPAPWYNARGGPSSRISAFRESRFRWYGRYLIVSLSVSTAFVKEHRDIKINEIVNRNWRKVNRC